MFSAKLVKFFIALLISMCLFSSCNWWKRLTGSPTPTPTPFAAQEIAGNLPFQTREPENYQAEFIISTFAGDEKTTKKIFVARNGIKNFTIFNDGEKSAFSSLKNENNITYLISTGNKAFTEDAVFSGTADESEESLGNFLMTEWLNGKTAVTFENIQTVDNVTTFRVNPDAAQNTEILVYIDENLKMPVKQEFYSTNEEQKKLLYSAEMTDFKSPAEEKYFAVPADYKKVSRKEFDKIISQD